ncbi:MAG TPA: fluoride efflux transporter CrcB [Sphingomonadaceae bacterium]|nr:fluoride efflux transporter CrcB [Sphingomonadaceae bacterium]
MPPLLYLVMLGGAVGAGLRYWVSRIALTQMGAGFPYGTLIVNLLGGFLMGLLAAILTRNGPMHQPTFLLLGTGVLGGFTTFSSFSLETYGMLERGQPMMALAYSGLSVAGALLLLILGFAVVRFAP